MIFAVGSQAIDCEKKTKTTRRIYASMENERSETPVRALAHKHPSTSRIECVSQSVEASFVHRKLVPIALSKAESVFVSSNGDVIVCRDRTGPFPTGDEPDPWNGYRWQDDLVMMCCDAECDDLSTNAQDQAFCGSWRSPQGGGLMGGAPAEVASPLYTPSRAAIDSDRGKLYGGGGNFNPTSALPLSRRRKENLKNRTRTVFRSPPLKGTADEDFDEQSIVPIRSFDYSHYGGDGMGNDMIPERVSLVPRTPPSYRKVSLPTSPMSRFTSPQNDVFSTFCHGVPTFLPSFSQVKVKQVSAHPLGSHVLLISQQSLLYSYGLNDFGQLGIGIQSPRHVHGGFIMTPSIVTPLVENGGKAIACAAGVNHSLVVVVTEERRIVKSQSFDKASSSPSHHNGMESICHHQLYGFGRNDFTKIGLVSPKISKPGSSDEMECVLLPRRVALRCKVRPEGSWPASSPPQGIFAIAASAEHSAALVRRASGDVEVYTWGNALYGALGLPQQPMAGRNHLAERHRLASAVRLVPVPSFVASLSRTSNYDAQIATILFRESGEYPVNLSLGRRSSFVITSLGRCFSFGVSDDGMLGLGKNVTEAQEPSEIALPANLRHDAVVSVSAGGAHTVATLRSGCILAWGRRSNAGLVSENRNRGSDGASNEDIAWSPEMVTCQAESSTNEHTAHFLQATAGYDSIALVSHSGRVFACGANSGRLGLGEIPGSDLSTPTRLFGGFRLWYQPDQTSRSSATRSFLPPAPQQMTTSIPRGITPG